MAINGNQAHRVARARPAQRLRNQPWQRAHIRAPMPPDVGRIRNTSERDALKLASECIRNGSAE